ncbi:uncharacterized protein LOC119679886 isoform X3 [Teleopsis dalmanni]|uniref:uncharacterized protein LOC119679886 isoform X3 n=1 Tax=Teleopsis dalmanni TaxID=139649 RepID=UPI0018CF9E94|nr:uncharacterized protein LOC119679886 isoform X3 [Teleopsis dalmanni]
MIKTSSNNVNDTTETVDVYFEANSDNNIQENMEDINDLTSNDEQNEENDGYDLSLSECSSLNRDESLDLFTEAPTRKNSSSTTSQNSDEVSLTDLYLNDIEIDRNEEEQAITELVRVSDSKEIVEVGQNSSMRVAFGIILRLMLPLANGVARSIKGIRDTNFLRMLKSIVSSRQALTNMVAFAANTISMNLSSVQVVTHRLEPILKLLKVRKSQDGLESLPDISAPATPIAPLMYSPFIREPKGSLPRFSTYKRKTTVPVQAAPKCCTLNILAEPPAGEPIRADIVFIHGLHGSLVNTWKQGLWENERQPVEFERPPKPPVRPPKRPRHSRSTVLRPPHKQKRARFAHSNSFKQSSERDTQDELETTDFGHGFSYVCGKPIDIKTCEGVEYSFPTFRLRMNDNGRLLQAELESILNKSDLAENNNNNKDNDHRKGKSSTKLSPDDPNYSKCWPGDWLPLDCPGVRVIAVNYTTDQYLWRPLWKKKEARTNLVQRSHEMAELLIKHQVGYGHPIIWVGHSKGGLFVKQIIVDAWESGKPSMAPFWRSARGCFFYSVPHRGSHLASIKAPLLTRSIELIDIEKNSKYLLDLHKRFACLYHMGHLRIEVFSFVETALTLMSVLYLRIVGVDSADPGIGDVCGIRLDHREICKPRSRECILYKELVKMIKKVY